MPDSDFDANEVTLKFLANGVYQEVMKDKNSKQTKPSKEDYKFYKKRVFSLHKEMLKGKYPTDNLKRVHMNYVNELIDYMKVIDRAEILQQEHLTVNTKIPCATNKKDGKLTPIAESCTMEADKGIMKQVEGKMGSLDNFVEKKIIKVNQPPPPPRQKKIDIKTDDHKVKGLKKKKKKQDKSST